MNLGNLLCAFIVAFFLYIMGKKKKKIDTMLQDFINYKKENLELRQIRCGTYIFRVKSIIFNMTK